MIGIKTRFLITDNSGGKQGECIKVLRKKYQHAKVGDFIVVAIKKVKMRKKMKVKIVVNFQVSIQVDVSLIKCERSAKVGRKMNYMHF